LSASTDYAKYSDDVPVEHNGGRVETFPERCP
jgi:hypothetical protein